MSLVLVLDANWLPLRVEPWQKAITDVFVGKTEVIEYSKDKTIQGVSRSYPMPSVVRILRRFKREKIRIKFSRLNIYARDRFTCQMCGQKLPTEDLTFDHVIPRAKGGRTTWENIVTACRACNASKADRTLQEAGMRLLSKPRKPSWLPTMTVRMDITKIPAEWRDYWSSDLLP